MNKDRIRGTILARMSDVRIRSFQFQKDLVAGILIYVLVEIGTSIQSFQIASLSSFVSLYKKFSIVVFPSSIDWKNPRGILLLHHLITSSFSRWLGDLGYRIVGS